MKTRFVSAEIGRYVSRSSSKASGRSEPRLSPAAQRALIAADRALDTLNRVITEREARGER